MQCWIGGVSVPVPFNGRYSLDMYINPPWPDAPVAESAPAAPMIPTTVTPIPSGQCAHVHSTVVGSRRTRVVEYFAGVGHATEGLPNMYETIAYVDHDNLAASAFKARNPDVPQWRDISDIMQSKEFDAVAATADVAFVGAPCADHSVLNPDHQPGSERGRLIFKALTKVQQLLTKVGVFEVVDGFLSTPQFGQFCAEAAPTHTVVPVCMNPLDYGVVQTRDRWCLFSIQT